jgi:hypothetical protein
MAGDAQHPATRRRRPGYGEFCMRLIFTLVLFTALGGCERDAATSGSGAETAPSLDAIAEAYVKIALALRPHDPAYVDAYFGPPEWAADAEASGRSLPELRAAAAALLTELHLPSDDTEDIIERRRDLLHKRLTSMLVRMDMAEGRYQPFDVESFALFDAVAPHYDAAYFAPFLARIEALLPGEGPLAERLERFRAQFVIPVDRLAEVFDAAIAECRRRTLAHIDLPADESFTIEYVTDQPWSGYNWYKGDYFSVIQINTDLPIHISRAVDLGCHEGYPGHHTYNVLLERELVDGRGWVEFALHPLYGPQSLVSEGSANVGVELAFPGEERLQFERDVLFPIAGIDPAQASVYYEILEALDELAYAENEAARMRLSGELDADGAADWLVRNALATRARAEQRVRFIETYRSYVINYNLGEDLVAAYINGRAGNDIERRWAELERLLAEPFAPQYIGRDPINDPPPTNNYRGTQ